MIRKLLDNFRPFKIILRKQGEINVFVGIYNQLQGSEVNIIVCFKDSQAQKVGNH